MKKIKQKNQSKVVVLLLVMLILATVGMFGLFFRYSENIHEKILKKDMEQIEIVSKYITKLIHAEMEHCIDLLNIGEVILYYDDDISFAPEDVVSDLKKAKKKSDFDSMGIVDLEGESIDDKGNRRTLSNRDFLKKIEKGNNYISDILIDGQRETGLIFIAVPLYMENRIEGAVWGQYPISVIAEKMEMTRDSDRYFQILDDQGRYISHSENKNAFIEKKSLWESLEEYEFSDGVTVEEIQKNIEERKSGKFHLKKGDSGKYVTYEPLGINKWYVFSVLREDFLDIYVGEINHLSMNLILYFAVFVAVFAGIVTIIVYNGIQTIQKQNHKLAIKTRLFEMVLGKTKDIPFELDVDEKSLKIYNNQIAGKNGSFKVINDFSPDVMLAEDRIKREDYQVYQEMYNKVIRGEEVPPLVLRIRIGGDWNWCKIHLLTVSQKSMIGFFEDYNEQAKQNIKMVEIDNKTKIDALTGLYNRSAFSQQVDRILREEKGGKFGISALFLIDLDFFKRVNDTLGHIIGDKVLSETAVNLKAVIRKTDLAGRLGGDEFVVFLRNIDSMESVHTCAEKLNAVLNNVYEKNGKSVTVSASIGVAIAEKGMCFQDLYEKADVVLYHVKNNRKNDYEIASCSREQKE